MKIRERLATPYTWIALLGAFFAAGLFACVFAFFLFAFMMVPVPGASHLAWALAKGPSTTITTVFAAVIVFVLVFLQLIRVDDEAQERDAAAHSSASASAPNLSDTAPDAPIAASEPEPEAHATPTRVDRFAVVLALIAYGFSVLFLPPFDCRSDEPFFKLAPIGGLPLLLFGWLGITVMDLRWFANPVLILMMVQLWKGSTKLMANMWPSLASLAAVTTVLLPAQVCSYQPSKSLAIGGYVWVLVLLTISALYAARLRKAKAEGRQEFGL